MKDTSEWLESFQSTSSLEQKFSFQPTTSENCQTIAFSSGKGGVGKTSITIKYADLLGSLGHRVLVIDCDFNLSNTLVKMQVPLSSSMEDLILGTKTFDECLYRNGNFDLLPGCNGSLDLLAKDIEFDLFVFNLISKYESRYDFILLDCPAGITKENLNLNAYCDHRFIIVNPDKSSITDSYSLMKIMKLNYGLNENHLIVNKVSHESQYKRIVRTLSETVESFLEGRLNLLGKVGIIEGPVDHFDRVLWEENNSIEEDLYKVFTRFNDGVTGPLVYGSLMEKNLNIEHEVHYHS